jgi:hypothetical protein
LDDDDDVLRIGFMAIVSKHRKLLYASSILATIIPTFVDKT